MHGLSALRDSMLLCTQASIFSSMVTCGLQPRLRHRKRSSTAESMRSMLMEGRGGAPFARHLCGRWYRRASCRVGLRTPASVSSSSCVDTVLGSR